MDSVLYGRPILFFTCEFRRYGSKKSDSGSNFKCNLAYFSAFERLKLRSEERSPMQNLADITMLYEPGPWDPAVSSSKLPILHVGFAEHILGRVPLTPCFLDGNSTNTIPHTKRSEAAAFPHGKCDSRAGAGDGSKVFEVNMPLWRFGRGKTRSMSVEDAERLRSERLSAARRQAGETRRRRRAARDE